ncbi:SIMPL domain-containing protein [Candidatus Odyssella acanthamoebae]|uniref:SIMPL domain-containing protein n=1 Tax=Candidatus Odyssella acanthamoebae TaxID=91604 RepID=A0A077B1Q3_9PROT|nr:SIMPL domain-containing protein [Candidatus Paracaedibacter acanthamoebae]AIK96870.1 hypothetical protein ID47_09180 [Candidatus Paracaedibacter acanthamoebae]
MAENKNFSGILSQLGLGVALGVATIACTAIVAKTYVKVKESQNSIQVKGYAEKRITSENAVWEGGINASNVDLIEAYKQLDQVKARTLELFKAEGYDPKQIKLGSINRFEVRKKSPDGHYELNEIERYNVSQNIEIASDDVQKLASLPSKMNELNLQGFDVTSGYVRFYYPSAKLDQLKVSLLAEASKSARERADQFALNSGNQISRLLNARQGVFQVTAPNSSDISDYGTYDTSSIEKVVKIVVTMTYGVE